jgi:hypothetical protein
MMTAGKVLRRQTGRKEMNEPTFAKDRGAFRSGPIPFDETMSEHADLFIIFVDGNFSSGTIRA